MLFAPARCGCERILDVVEPCAARLLAFRSREAIHDRALGRVLEREHERRRKIRRAADAADAAVGTYRYTTGSALTDPLLTVRLHVE